MWPRGVREALGPGAAASYAQDAQAFSGGAAHLDVTPHISFYDRLAPMRAAPAPGSAYAVFRGGGIELMEASVKGRADDSLADEAMIRPDEDDGAPPDLTGLSCRWTPVKATRGRMVSLVLRCTDHQAVHHEIARIAGLDALTPVTQAG